VYNRYVLSALRKAAWESVTFNEWGRLFQTCGPYNENARLLKWVLVRQDLFADDRSWRLWESLVHKVMTSSR